MRRWRGPAAAVVLALALVGCSDDGSGAPAPTTLAILPAGQVEEAVAGLCQARAEADTDVNAARTTFYDRSHEPLHGIARALEPVDRPLVTGLLEAKVAVETDLGARTPAPTLTADLDRLLELTRASLARLSVASPPCR